MTNIRKRGDNPAPKPTPAPTTPSPAPQPVSTQTGVPTGPIKTAGFPQVRWEDITRYDQYLSPLAESVGWPMARLRGHIVIESGGNAHAVQQNNSNGWSYGLFQIVPFGVGWEGWNSLVKRLAKLPANASREQVVEALYNPAVNCAAAVQILEGLYQQHGSLDKASSAFFLGNPDWRGADTVNGNTGAGYKRTLESLITEQKAFAPPDLISYIVSGARYTAEFGFGEGNWDERGNPVNLYQYGVGHGEGLVRANQHTGLDIVVPLYTPIRTPLSGVVRCVGNAGEGDWGQGCGSFADTIGGGIGNVTVLTDAGLKLTFGHVNSSPLRVGQRVVAGDIVAYSGGMVGPHLHLDASTNRNGSYWLLDPIPAIAKALGQTIPVPPPSYALPQPPFNRDFRPNTTTVTATVDGVPVLQRADKLSAATNKPLAKGDDFDAVALIIGEDGKLWWVSSRGSRIPLEGTASTLSELPSTTPPVTCPPVPDISKIPGALADLKTIQATANNMRLILEGIK